MLVILQATFGASGVATVDTAASDPGLTLVKDTVGDYDLAGLPKGARIHYVGGALDSGSDVSLDSGTGYVQPYDLDPATGTGKLMFFNRDDGDQADPPDGARVYATFIVEGG